MLFQKKMVIGQMVLLLTAGSAYAANTDDLDGSMQVVGEQVESQAEVSDNMELAEQHRNRYQARMQERSDERNVEHMGRDDAKEQHHESRDEMHEEHQEYRDGMREDHLADREDRREDDASASLSGNSEHDSNYVHH